MSHSEVKQERAGLEPKEMPNLPQGYTGPTTTAPLGTFSGTAPALRSLRCMVILGKLFPFYPLPFVGVIVGIRKVLQKAPNVHVQLSPFNSTPRSAIQT